MDAGLLMLARSAVVFLGLTVMWGGYWCIDRYQAVAETHEARNWAEEAEVPTVLRARKERVKAFIFVLLFGFTMIVVVLVSVVVAIWRQAL